MSTAIDDYFNDCEGKPIIDDNGDIVLDKNGEPMVTGKHPPTVTGLALWLGFNSRQSFLNYRTRSQAFNALLTKAKSKCEEFAERHLYDHSCSSGAKFSLENNFSGWGKDDGDTNDIQNTELSRLYKALTANSKKDNENEVNK